MLWRWQSRWRGLLMLRPDPLVEPEVIAEAGSNHDGSVERAKRLIELAQAAGASSVKFQFIFPEGLYLPAFRDGGQLYPNPAFGQRASEQLTPQQWREIWRHGERVGMELSASVFCKNGVDLLAELGANYVKIASTDLTNLDLINLAAERFDRVLVSTGMATIGEVSRTVEMVREQHSHIQLELLHCVSSYPCPVGEANPARVRLLRDAFGLRVGYSDHTEGYLSAILALCQGANLFEKHFTDDRTRPGFDHSNAAELEQLLGYITALRDASLSMSQGANRNAEQEVVTKVRARRGIYAASDLPRGHILTAGDLLHVRPSTTQSYLPSDLIGQPLVSDVRQYSALGLSDGAGIISSLWREAADYWDAEMVAKGMRSPADETAME